MTEKQDSSSFLYDGLRELAESTFPKRCSACGRVFETAADFVSETETVGRGGSGLKQSVDDDGNPIVELFRNCVCGSTLMGFFSDRRDLTERGLQRRKRFGELMDYLVAQGMDRDLAREELKKVVRGEKSEVLARHRPPPKAG